MIISTKLVHSDGTHIAASTYGYMTVFSLPYQHPDDSWWAEIRLMVAAPKRAAVFQARVIDRHGPVLAESDPVNLAPSILCAVKMQVISRNLPTRHDAMLELQVTTGGERVNLYTMDMLSTPSAVDRLAMIAQEDGER